MGYGKYKKTGRGYTRNSKWRSRRRRKAGAKSRLPMSRLSTKAIDSRVEVRMQEIAKSEISKNRKLLTSRKYLYHDYNKITNTWTPLTTVQGQNTIHHSLIDWEGSVVELSNIPQVDVNFETNVPQADDPETKDDENSDGDGSGQGAMTQTMQGRRHSDQIYIQSVSAELRIRQERLADSDPSKFGHTTVYYAFVLWRGEEVTMDNVTTKPDYNQLCRKPRPWGYSSKLDLALEQVFNGLKTKVLCRGSTKIPLDDVSTSEKFTTIYKKFKNPIKVQFQVDSQNGQKANKKLYFCCASTIPALENIVLKPSVAVCTKVNYFEA